MGKNKRWFKKLLYLVISVFIILGPRLSIQAKLPFSQAEKDYIEKGNVIKAVSNDGTAPFQYTDKKGEIKGISKRILDEVSEETGLVFEYKLYDSLEELFTSDYDLIFGISANYNSKDLILSRAYLKTETILYTNSHLNIDDLGNRKYAAIDGGTLPSGIDEENVTYYKTREESLNAVESGEADFGYGNPYSVAYYTLQNGYKNIVTIPNRKDLREYSIGVQEENKMLLSIINKALATIDNPHLQSIILDEASNVDRAITITMIMDTYGKQVLSISFIIMATLFSAVIINMRAKNKLELQNKRYELLSDISNEYLYEYHIEDNYVNLSKECMRLFGSKENLKNAKNSLKEVLLDNKSGEAMEEIKLPLVNGVLGAFRVVISSLEDDKGKVYSIIGKLVDITKEAEEKEELIIKSQLDGLTGLYNASTSKQLINARIKEKTLNKIDALIVIDCDDFKYVNDTFGHLVGDEVLKELSRALKSTFRESDIIGRVGGDEFCVYVKDIQSIELAKLKSDELNNLIKEINVNFNFSTSIGIAQLTNENTYKELFEKADKAMYQAKKNGKSQAYIYKKSG